MAWFSSVCSAYHGHVSSLIDISPYKFHQLSDAEQNPFVHVVSAFYSLCVACLRSIKTPWLNLLCRVVAGRWVFIHTLFADRHKCVYTVCVCVRERVSKR